ncbi:hypothetical protein ACO0KW_13985 [Undibacterium sp. Ji22W]
MKELTMAIWKADLSNELGQIENAMVRVSEDTLKPMLSESIAMASTHLEQVVDRASNSLNEVVENAGKQLNESIDRLSSEVHSHRSITKDDIKELIEFAADQMGNMLDQRISALKEETSSLINDKTQMLRQELEDAAIRSRKTMYTNAAISIGAAICMAVVGFFYKQVSLDQIDLLSIFRIALLSLSVGSGIASILKIVQHWRSMSESKKNTTTVVISYLGVLRPNGAMGLFVLSVVLLMGWGGLLHLPKFLHLG